MQQFLFIGYLIKSIGFLHCRNKYILRFFFFIFGGRRSEIYREPKDSVPPQSQHSKYRNKKTAILLQV